jgi:hypothetical protein
VPVVDYNRTGAHGASCHMSLKIQAKSTYVFSHENFLFFFLTIPGKKIRPLNWGEVYMQQEQEAVEWIKDFRSLHICC